MIIVEAEQHNIYEIIHLAILITNAFNSGVDIHC